MYSTKELEEKLGTVIRQANDNQTYATALLGMVILKVTDSGRLTRELRILNDNLKILAREITYVRGRL